MPFELTRLLYSAGTTVGERDTEHERLVFRFF